MAQYPSPGDWRQVALAAATSPDGFNFTETQTNLATNGGTSWHSWEVRSPHVIQDGNLFKAWFAGHSGLNDWTTAGIGYASTPFCVQ